jgi:hypothetical protein
MKKSELRQIIKEELQGFSKYVGKTKGGTTDDFRNILTKIAKGQDGDKYQGDPEKGNKILDKANPENVARILKGEKPVYESKEKEYKIEYAYRYGKDGDDTDFDIIKIKATSESEAIKKAKQEARRLAIQSSFKVIK